MSVDCESESAPNWLENLEKLREKRVHRRLGHEAGAGAPCLDCGDKCPGLDLHFWRKICKNCKCGKESHNVEDDDTCGWVQFQLLGTKPVKTKGFTLPGSKTSMNLDFMPPGSIPAVKRYLDELPTDQMPISGSDAAKTRLQRLQTQLPAHDLDATLCDSLTPAEMTQMNEYVSHVRQHCVGQGKLIELPIHMAGHHIIPEPESKLMTEKISQTLVNSEPVMMKPSAIADKISKLKLHDNKNILHDDLINSNVNIACHECLEPLENGAVAISIERTDAKWHPQCFKCHTCQEQLADLVYFYHKVSGHVYCGRDFAKIKGIPRCSACDELIFVNESCLAEDSIFHIKHFCCWECDTPLAGKEYLMEKNKPMCLPCYELTMAAKCQDCGLIIGPQQQGAQLQGLHWHAPECFVCRQCRKCLIGGKMLLQKENIFCSGTCVALASGPL